MKYRMIAIDFMLDDRPLQSFAMRREQAFSWAEAIAKKYGCAVAVYEIKEELLQIVEPEKK